jgi:hypothetical protein
MSDSPTVIRALEQVLPNLRQALRNLQFGVVELQIHDFRVVRITRTEKLRVLPESQDSELAQG